MFIAPALEIDVKVGEQRLTEDVSNLLRINPDAILDDLLEHSATYAYIATLRVMAEANAREFKTLLNRLRAEMMLEFEDQKEAGKKMTIAVMEASIEVSASYIEARETYEKADHIVQQLTALTNAFEHRRHMLSSAANVIRASETPVFVSRETPKEAVAEAKAREAKDAPKARKRV